MTSALLEMTSALMDMPIPTTTTPTEADRPGPGGVDRILLTGFMGAGKTTVGSLLAERLGWRFLDLDREVERRTGRTVPQIFEEDNEAIFRRFESTALAGLLGQRRAVIALGGGAPEALGNRLLLEQTPRTAIVYLEAPLGTLLDRCAGDDGRAGAALRPLLAEAQARYKERHPLYRRIATHTVGTDALPIAEVASAILKALRMAP